MAKKIKWNQPLETVDGKKAKFLFTTNDVKGKFAKYKNHVSVYWPEHDEAGLGGYVAFVYDDYGNGWEPTAPKLINVEVDSSQTLLDPNQWSAGDEIKLVDGNVAKFVSVDLFYTGNYNLYAKVRPYPKYVPFYWSTKRWDQHGKSASNGIGNIDTKKLKMTNAEAIMKQAFEEANPGKSWEDSVQNPKNK